MQMRILEITGEPILHGGQEIFIQNVLENINNSDLIFDVLTPYYCKNHLFVKLIESKKGKVYELNLNFKPGKSRKNLFKPIYAFLKRNKYDVVHIHSGSISVLAYEALASRKAGIKQIIVHSHSTGKKGIKHIVLKSIFFPFLFWCPTKYLACSKEAGMMKYPILKHRDIVVIKNGIDLEKFSRNEFVGKKLRKKYGIPENAFVIGHIGRFTVEKNQSFLVDVFMKVHEKNKESYLIFVGDGELIKNVKNKVEKYNLQNYVIFTGNVDNPQDMYNIMNIFVLPSEYEGFSFVTLEAQANGLPCLVSMGVPDAVLLTDNVRRVQTSVESWFDIIMNNNYEIFECKDIIKKKGFDIKDTALFIEKIYTNGLWND